MDDFQKLPDIFSEATILVFFSVKQSSESRIRSYWWLESEHSLCYVLYTITDRVRIVHKPDRRSPWRYFVCLTATHSMHLPGRRMRCIKCKHQSIVCFHARRQDHAFKSELSTACQRSSGQNVLDLAAKKWEDFHNKRQYSSRHIPECSRVLSVVLCLLFSECFPMNSRMRLESCSLLRLSFCMSAMFECTFLARVRDVLTDSKRALLVSTVLLEFWFR
jgi:hypothetical protein